MNFKKMLFAGAVVSVALFSCKKDKDDDGEVLPASMNAVISGFTMNQTENEAVIDTAFGASKDLMFITRKALLINDVFTITGTTLGLDVINVTIRGAEEGKYVLSLGDLNDPKARCGATITTSYVNLEGEEKKAQFLSNRGTVVLTKVDRQNKRVSGTFEFDMLSGDVYKAIRKGKFENLKYSTN